MLANNLANAQTGGYKADREFYSLYLDAEVAQSTEGLPTKQPVIERHWTDFSQGTLRNTGNSLDLALAGKGFFAVGGPNGPLYTRNGSLKVSPTGQLVTSDGFPVRTAGGGRIQLQPTGAIEVATDGTVRQSGVVAGRIEIVDFPNPAALAKAATIFAMAIHPRRQFRQRRPKYNKAGWRILMLAPPNQRCAWWELCASSRCCRRRSHSVER